MHVQTPPQRIGWVYFRLLDDYYKKISIFLETCSESITCTSILVQKKMRKVPTNSKILENTHNQPLTSNTRSQEIYVKF